MKNLNIVSTVLVSSILALPVIAQADSVMADNQPLMENGVVATQVTSENNGWLVVHRSDETATPGAVIGHTAVPAGESSDVSVELSEEVASGDYLMFMLHTDAGEMGVYEFAGENRADVPVMADGKPVIVNFMVE